MESHRQTQAYWSKSDWMRTLTQETEEECCSKVWCLQVKQSLRFAVLLRIDQFDPWLRIVEDTVPINKTIPT